MSDVKKNNKNQAEFIEDQDYYFENGLYVFTSKFLEQRGYCCKNGCRHCPYGFERNISKISPFNS